MAHALDGIANLPAQFAMQCWLCAEGTLQLVLVDDCEGDPTVVHGLRWFSYYEMTSRTCSCLYQQREWEDRVVAEVLRMVKEV